MSSSAGAGTSVGVQGCVLAMRQPCTCAFCARLASWYRYPGIPQAGMKSVEQAWELPPLTKVMLTRVECNAHRKTIGAHVHTGFKFLECKACRTIGDIYNDIPPQRYLNKFRIKIVAGGS
jgi:hypothetical protein